MNNNNDSYKRVKIGGVDYRIYQEYAREDITKNWQDLFPRKRRLLVIEQAKPWPITKSERYFLHMTTGGAWGMFPIDYGGKVRKYLNKVEFCNE